MLDDMEPGTKQGINPHPFTLRALKPELLMVLRHVGMDLLAYDGAPCSEAVGPLTEAARRIEADPAFAVPFSLPLQGRYQFRNSGRPPMGRREVRRSSTWHHPQDPNRAALAVQLISPTGRSASPMPVTRTLQGMARIRSGQAPAWPLASGRSARRGLQGQA